MHLEFLCRIEKVTLLQRPQRGVVVDVHFHPDEIATVAAMRSDWKVGLRRESDAQLIEGVAGVITSVRLPANTARPGVCRIHFGDDSNILLELLRDIKNSDTGEIVVSKTELNLQAE